MSMIDGAGTVTFDAVTLQILWDRVAAVADEMARTVGRTAFSRLMRESRDFSCVVLDARADALAQSANDVPAFTGAIPIAVRSLLQAFPPEALRPGDVLATNDPWLCAGQLNDLCVCTPVFYEERAVGFVATIGHLSDIGGLQWSAAASEVHEEGLCLPPCMLYRGGEPVAEMFGILRSNVRLPDEVVGDIEAMVAANSVGARRLREVMREHALDSLDGLGYEIKTRTRRAIQEVVDGIPEGEYRKDLVLDGFESELRMGCTVGVSHARGLTVDYTGSAQVPHGVNSVMNYTRSFTLYALKAALIPQIPNNEGVVGSFAVTAPEGSILNARRPAAVSARHLVGHYCVEAVLGALAPALPGRVAAGNYSPIWIVNVSGEGESGAFSGAFLVSGGLGARQGRDGMSCVMFPSGTGSTPSEVMEAGVPCIIERKAIRPGSAGAGTFRGGFGQEIRVRFTSDAVKRVSLQAERLRHAPSGVAGGEDGALGEIRLNGESQPGKAVLQVKAGDVLELYTPGGGGWGSPADRDPALVSDDRAAGLVH